MAEEWEEWGRKRRRMWSSRAPADRSPEKKHDCQLFPGASLEAGKS